MELKQCLRLRHGLSSTTVHPQEHSYPLESATGVLSLEKQLSFSLFISFKIGYHRCLAHTSLHG